MKLVWILFLLPFMSLTQEGNSTESGARFRGLIGFNSFDGVLGSGQIEVNRNHQSFIFDASYSEGPISKVTKSSGSPSYLEGVLGLTDGWTSYATNKDVACLFVLNYGYTSHGKRSHLSLTAGPMVYVYYDEKIAPTEEDKYHQETTNTTYLGGMAMMQAEIVSRRSIGYGIGIKMGYLREPYIGFQFSLSYGYKFKRLKE